MPDRDCGPHCPFLNRSDARCSSFFSLDHLGHAFEHCFDDYKACPLYAEMLRERMARRQATALQFHGTHPGNRTDAPTKPAVVHLTVFPPALAARAGRPHHGFVAHANP